MLEKSKFGKGVLELVLRDKEGNIKETREIKFNGGKKL